MNLDLLNGRIYSCGVKKVELAELLGISTTSLRHKLMGEVDFRISEVAKISEVLKLTPQEREVIFFNKNDEK